MDDYVSRSAVLASVLHEDPSLAYTVTRVPVADVMPVDKLSPAGRLLLECCPEFINSLADRIATGLSKWALEGIQNNIADMPEDPAEEKI